MSHMRSAARHKLHFEHRPVDPHTDIRPPRRHCIQIRQVVERANGTDLRYEAACCYGPDGRCVGKLSIERLQLLRDRYDAVHMIPPVAPRLGRILPASGKSGGGLDAAALVKVLCQMCARGHRVPLVRKGCEPVSRTCPSVKQPPQSSGGRTFF